MIANKHISKIVAAVMAAAVILCLLAVAFSDKLEERFGSEGLSMEYETELFDTSEPIRIDIQMDGDDWDEMLANASSEKYSVCDVTVNGEKFYNVAIRPKGNTSLSAIVMDPDTDRFSLKLEFDHYVDGQSCFGLDKLILNNNYADATNMKEALIYDMFEYLDVDAPLYNYAEIYVNGEYWGVYLALESVEESFMLRNYGTQDGELYKPESMDMGGGDKAGGGMPDMSNMPDMGDIDFSNFDFSDFEGMAPPDGNFPGRPGSTEETAADGQAAETEGADTADTSAADAADAPAGGFDPSNRPDMGDFNGGGGMPGGSSGGSDLNYTDDDPDSYSTIWEGEVTDTGSGDHSRVITALKNISEGTDLETYLDVDNVLKYMAVHTFAVTLDSLSGNMAHNYYLYESGGQLNIIPWDYNLSFGGMSMGSSGNASDMINDAIDTPFSGTEFFDALLENEEYLARYHAYLQQLVDEYVNGGGFDEFYNRTRMQIDSLVETDPTAFYSYDEYLTAADMLYRTVKLRAESISGQLDGTIPSTDEGQRADSSGLVDASDIDIQAMGTFGMGVFGGGPDRDSGEETSEQVSAEEPGDETGAEETADAGQAVDPSGGPDTGSENSEPGSVSAQSLSQTAQQDGGSAAQGAPQMPEDFDPSDLPEGFDPSNMPDMGGDRPEPGSAPAQPDAVSSATQGSGQSAPQAPESADSETAPAADAGQTETEVPAGQEQAADDTQAGADDSEDSADTENANTPASFPGQSGQSSAQTQTDNLITYGICLAIMVAALFIVKCL